MLKGRWTCIQNTQKTGLVKVIAPYSIIPCMEDNRSVDLEAAQAV